MDDDGIPDGGISIEDEAADGDVASEVGVLEKVGMADDAGVASEAGVLERVGMADDASVAVDGRAGDADAKDEPDDAMLETPGNGVDVVAMTGAKVVDAGTEGVMPGFCDGANDDCETAALETCDDVDGVTMPGVYPGMTPGVDEGMTPGVNAKLTVVPVGDGSAELAGRETAMMDVLGGELEIAYEVASDGVPVLTVC